MKTTTALLSGPERAPGGTDSPSGHSGTPQGLLGAHGGSELIQVQDIDNRWHAACRIEGCETDVLHNGVCQAHYWRFRRKGTYDLKPRPTLNEQILRFDSFINKTATCWLWIGATCGRDGNYGRFFLNGQAVLAHRFAYEIWVGPIPVGYDVDHVYERGCRNTLCVNPAHLEAVTPEENQRRQVTGSSGVNRRKTECKYGHPFSPDNTGHTAFGYRVCLTCNGVTTKARAVDCMACVNGHPFASEHGAVDRAGRRYCRTCKQRSHVDAAADVVRRREGAA